MYLEKKVFSRSFRSSLFDYTNFVLEFSNITVIMDSFVSARRIFHSFEIHMYTIESRDKYCDVETDITVGGKEDPVSHRSAEFSRKCAGGGGNLTLRFAFFPLSHFGFQGNWISLGAGQKTDKEEKREANRIECQDRRNLEFWNEWKSRRHPPSTKESSMKNRDDSVDADNASITIIFPIPSQRRISFLGETFTKKKILFQTPILESWEKCHLRSLPMSKITNLFLTRRHTCIFMLS